MKTLSINRKPSGDLLKSKRITPAQETPAVMTDAGDAAPAPVLLAPSGKQIPSAGRRQMYEDLKRGLRKLKSKEVTPVFEKRPDLQAVAAFWPAMFTPDNPKPLVTGAYEQLMEDVAARGLKVKSFTMRAMLRAYCERPVYRASYLTAEYRVGIDGSPAGHITDDVRERMQKIPPQLTPEIKKARMAEFTQQINALEDQYDFSFGVDSDSLPD